MRFALDELFGERELVVFDGDLLDVVEVFGGLAELFLVAHDVGHHAGELVVVVGHDGDEVFAATEGDLAEGDLLGGLEGFADDGEGFGLGVAFGDDEVGLLEERGGDLVVVDELLDLEGVAGGDAEVVDLFGLDGDVLALAVLVAFDDLALFDGAFVRAETFWCLMRSPVLRLSWWKRISPLASVAVKSLTPKETSEIWM